MTVIGLLYVEIKIIWYKETYLSLHNWVLKKKFLITPTYHTGTIRFTFNFELHANFLLNTKILNFCEKIVMLWLTEHDFTFLKINWFENAAFLKIFIFLLIVDKFQNDHLIEQNYFLNDSKVLNIEGYGW
jgi:hypothetical protein